MAGTDAKKFMEEMRAGDPELQEEYDKIQMIVRKHEGWVKEQEEEGVMWPPSSFAPFEAGWNARAGAN